MFQVVQYFGPGPKLTPCDWFEIVLQKPEVKDIMSYLYWTLQNNQRNLTNDKHIYNSLSTSITLPIQELSYQIKLIVTAVNPQF